LLTAFDYSSSVVVTLADDIVSSGRLSSWLLVLKLFRQVVVERCCSSSTMVTTFFRLPFFLLRALSRRHTLDKMGLLRSGKNDNTESLNVRIHVQYLPLGVFVTHLSRKVGAGYF
jgi:hypothetical protein